MQNNGYFKTPFPLNGLRDYIWCETTFEKCTKMANLEPPYPPVNETVEWKGGSEIAIIFHYSSYFSYISYELY